MISLLPLAIFFNLPDPCQAHMVSSSGLVHPLNGIDHLSAMVAVGVYSVQLGGRGVYAVPISFLLAMLIGGVIGFEQYILYYTELGIALSVVLLGMAIGMRSNISLWLAGGRSLVAQL